MPDSAPCSARRAARALIAPALALVLTGIVGPPVAAAEDDARWQALRTMLFAERAIEDASQWLTLDAPQRAFDAALVPITIAAASAQTPERYIKTLTLLIDENPSPIAGRFHLTPASGLAHIETRVRVNAYTHVRAIAEMNDGSLHMTTRFVKASGGCSAPAGKDFDAAMSRIGRMKLRSLGDVVLGAPNRAQLLISHPNTTGMQMDQLTRLYVPAHYVRTIDVKLDGTPVLSVESDISLSEDPSIHFHFVPSRADAELTVEVVDTEDNRFAERWPVAGGS